MNIAEFICPVCHFGKLQDRRVTHTQVFEGQLIAISNVAALVCDVCGERILDDQVLTRLSGLLGPGRRTIDTATHRHSWP
jgi:YgiT-type zinc finger domain-containing protein